MITGEIKRFLRDDGIIKVSRSLKEIAVKVKITREILNNRLNREPTIEELSIEMEVATEDIVMALESNTEVESLYKTIYQGDGNAIFLIDKLEQVQDDHESVVDKLAIQEILDTLEQKEQDIIKLRYFMNRTQSDIAKKLGISQVQVSRLEKKILRTMREKLIG